MCGKIALEDKKNADFERVFAKTDAQKAPPIPRGRRSSGGLGYFRLDDAPDGVLLKFSFFVKESGMDKKRRAKKREKLLQCPV